MPITKGADRGEMPQTSYKQAEPVEETELEWCARIERVKPSGTKGLAFVLRELKKAQIEGKFKERFKKGRGLNIFGKRM